jgi:hypothetical protein
MHLSWGLYVEAFDIVAVRKMKPVPNSRFPQLDALTPKAWREQLTNAITYSQGLSVDTLCAAKRNSYCDPARLREEIAQ